MEKYSVSVALFDYLPVIVSAVGMYFLARALRHWLPGLAGVITFAAVAIPLGGLCKASWKLLIALGHAPIPWLENMLFILLAPGFVILAFAMHHTRCARKRVAPANNLSARRLWMCLLLIWPVAAILAVSLPQSRAWFFYLLAVTTLANASLIVQAVLTARLTQSHWTTYLLLIVSFSATLSLSGLSRLPDTEMTAWIQESVNLSAQLTLAIAFYLLAQSLLINRPTARTLTPE